jgi:ArsR family transcriptional regulator
MPHALRVDLARVAQWFHAFSDTKRLALLELLSHRERSVTELRDALGGSQSSISFHLKVLKDSGVISARRVGRWRYYDLRGETLQHIIAFTQIVSPGAHTGTCPLSCCR